MQTFLERDLRERITRAAAYRKRILDARDDTPYSQLAQELAMADQAIGLARITGDVAVAAFFASGKRAGRADARTQYESEVKAYIQDADMDAGGRAKPQ